MVTLSFLTAPCFVNAYPDTIQHDADNRAPVYIPGRGPYHAGVDTETISKSHHESTIGTLKYIGVMDREMDMSDKHDIKMRADVKSDQITDVRRISRIDWFLTMHRAFQTYLLDCNRRKERDLLQSEGDHLTCIIAECHLHPFI